MAAKELIKAIEINTLALNVAEVLWEGTWIYGATHAPAGNVKIAPQVNLQKGWLALIAQRRLASVPQQLAIEVTSATGERLVSPISSRDAFLDLFRLSLEDVAGIAAYVQKYGVISEAMLVLPKSLEGTTDTPVRTKSDIASAPAVVKKYVAACEKRKAIPFAIELSELAPFANEIIDLANLFKAGSEYDKPQVSKIKAAYEEKVKVLITAVCDGEGHRRSLFDFDIKDYPDLHDAWKNLFAFGLNSILENAKVNIFRHRNREFHGAISTTYVHDALCLELVDIAAQGLVIQDCANERCSGKFIKRLGTKRFCSESCQALAKAYRFINSPIERQSGLEVKAG